jgi:hypothetical protein
MVELEEAELPSKVPISFFSYIEKLKLIVVVYNYINVNDNAPEDLYTTSFRKEEKAMIWMISLVDQNSEKIHFCDVSSDNKSIIRPVAEPEQTLQGRLQFFAAFILDVI